MYLRTLGWTDADLNVVSFAAQLARHGPFIASPDWRRTARRALRLTAELRRLCAELSANGPDGPSRAHPAWSEFGFHDRLVAELDAFTRLTDSALHPPNEWEAKELARAKGAAFALRLFRELRRFPAWSRDRPLPDALELIACAVIAGAERVAGGGSLDAEDEREHQVWSWKKARAKALEILSRH